MRLDNGNAIGYGAGGAIGGAVARAFAREGAKVFLAGRTHDAVEAVAKDITADEGVAEAAQLDAVDGRTADRRNGPVLGGIEALTRGLAAELGLQGVRVVCLRPAGYGVSRLRLRRSRTGRVRGRRRARRSRAGRGSVASRRHAERRPAVAGHGVRR